jgi:hypothetical protein
MALNIQFTQILDALESRVAVTPEDEAQVERADGKASTDEASHDEEMSSEVLTKLDEIEVDGTSKSAVAQSKRYVSRSKKFLTEKKLRRHRARTRRHSVSICVSSTPNCVDQLAITSRRLR